MALPDTFSLTTSTGTTVISAASVAAGSNFLSSVFDNSAALAPQAAIEIVFACQTVPAAGAVFEVYTLYAPDGTNYESGAGVGTGTGDVDPLTGFVWPVAVAANTNSYRVMIRGVQLEPFLTKILVKSELAVALTLTSVKVFPYKSQAND